MLLVQAFYGAWCTSVGGSLSLHCEYSNLGTLHRPHSVSITEFGAVGDGVTLNTKAFQNALFYLNSFSDKGGAKLFVPAGQWLTGSFDLISHLTLWLDKGATILGSTASFHIFDTSIYLCYMNCVSSRLHNLLWFTELGGLACG